MKKLEADMNAAMEKMNREASRVAMDPQIMQVIGPVMQKMGE